MLEFPTPPVSDLEAKARGLLRSASALAYVWSPDVAGYVATFELDAGGHAWHGRVSVVGRDRVNVSDVADATVAEWVRATLAEQVSDLATDGFEHGTRRRLIAADRRINRHPRGERVFAVTG